MCNIDGDFIRYNFYKSATNGVMACGVLALHFSYYLQCLIRCYFRDCYCCVALRKWRKSSGWMSDSLNFDLIVSIFLIKNFIHSFAIFWELVSVLLSMLICLERELLLSLVTSLIVFHSVFVLFKMFVMYSCFTIWMYFLASFLMFFAILHDSLSFVLIATVSALSLSLSLSLISFSCMVHGS